MKLRRDIFIPALTACAAAWCGCGAQTRTIDLCGRVTASGKGVAGVAVTDGRTIVRTDSTGYYLMPTTSEADLVYISLPDGYEVPAKEDAAACLYRRIGDPGAGYDFTLEPTARPSERHRVVVIADPQVYFDCELDSLRRAAADIRRLASDGIPTVGLVCGDIIGDITRRPPLFDAVHEALAASGIPLFYVAGNHDMDLGVRTNDYAKRSFRDHFGPTCYSFDRGRVHFVVLDDCFYIGRSYLYVGYLDEGQLCWLEQDLAGVEPGRTVVVAMHIPTWSRAARRGEWGCEESNKVLNNRQALYRLLEPYNAHLLTAHEHYNENYPLRANLYEHVHAPLSTLFWQTPRSMDGVPAGYGVYEFAGDSVTWYYKAVDYDRSRQFTAYGVGEDPQRPDAVTVNVWNRDPDWQVCWFENSEPRGAMTPCEEYDAAISDYVRRHGATFKHRNIGADRTEHLYYAVPSSPDAAIRIEVRDRFGNLSVWESGTGYLTSRHQTQPTQ